MSDQYADAPIDPEQCIRIARAHLRLAEQALQYSTIAQTAAWRCRDALADIGMAETLAISARKEREAGVGVSPRRAATRATLAERRVQGSRGAYPATPRTRHEPDEVDRDRDYEPDRDRDDPHQVCRDQNQPERRE